MEIISVIVPAYNVKMYLERCMNSIIHQTYQALEIILVDDGSTDGTGELCDEIAKRDARIIVIHKENGGLADARNAGLEIASGAFVSFIDSDDYIETDMYESMIAEMKDASVSIVEIGMIVTDTKGCDSLQVSDRRLYLTREEAFLHLLEYGKLLSSSANKLFRRSLFDKLRYKKGIHYEDTEIIPKLLHECDHVVILDKAFYHYVLRNGSIMRSDFSIKDYRSLIAYKTASRICRGNYPKVYPFACYYELSELYEAQVRLANSSNYKALRRQAFALRMDIAEGILRCLRWKEIRQKYRREILIYLSSVLIGYRFTYRLMMMKQKMLEKNQIR